MPNYDHVGAITNVKGRLVVSLNNISTPDYGAVYSYSKIKKAKHGKVLKPGYRVRFSGDADFAILTGLIFGQVKVLIQTMQQCRATKLK